MDQQPSKHRPVVSKLSAPGPSFPRGKHVFMEDCFAPVIFLRVSKVIVIYTYGYIYIYCKHEGHAHFGGKLMPLSAFQHVLEGTHRVGHTVSRGSAVSDHFTRALQKDSLYTSVSIT